MFTLEGNPCLQSTSASLPGTVSRIRAMTLLRRRIVRGRSQFQDFLFEPRHKVCRILIAILPGQSHAALDIGTINLHSIYPLDPEHAKVLGVRIRIHEVLQFLHVLLWVTGGRYGQLQCPSIDFGIAAIKAAYWLPYRCRRRMLKRLSIWQSTGHADLSLPDLLYRRYPKRIIYNL